MIHRRLFLGASATLLTGRIAAPALAQGSLADRPIRVIVPFAAGGGVDVYARLLTEKIRQTRNLTFVIDNRGGANGTLGGSAVRSAAPDGTTLLFSAGTHVMARHVMTNAPYDPLADFGPIARAGAAPMMLVMAPRLAPASVAELVAEAKRQQDKWSFSTSALGAPGHLATVAFNARSGMNLPIITYRGTAPALNDVAGGHVQLLIDPVLALLPMASSGAVKGLGVTTAQRTALAPAYPPIAEAAGLAGFDYSSWYGVWGPRQMPGGLVGEINGLFNQAVKDLEAEGKLAAIGIEPITETPDAFATFSATYVEQNGALLKAAGFQPI
jgi:tripartite-type tricarboxylate transporter receptor subunit TctC